MTIRIAVTGLGYWGPNLLRAFNEATGCRVTQIVDSAAAKLEKAAKICPSAETLSSFDDLLARDCDAVVVATPAETHFALGMKALESGRDVFVEKPVTLSTEEAERLAETAERKGRILMIGHLLLYHPAYVEAVKRLRAGEFGDLRYLYARRVNLGIVRSHENALWSLAPHDIAVSDWVVGASPVEAQAVGLSCLQPGIEDVVFYTLRYPSNVIFHGHVSWLDPQKVRELSVIGTEKMAVVDDTASEKLRIYNRAVETQRQPFTSYGQFLSIRTGDVLLPHLPSAEPLRQEVSHFLECVRERKRPLSDGASGVSVVRSLNALTRSLRGGGGWVPL